MKKKLLVLSVLATLTLVGCGGGNQQKSDADLPAGGKEVDVTTEDGQEVLEARIKNAVKAVATKNPSAIHASVTSKDYNLEVGAQVDMGEAISANLTAKVAGAGAKVSLDASKHSAQDSSLDAKLALSDVSGSLSLKGSATFVMAEGADPETANINQSLDLGGLSASAYLTGGKAYADLSDTKTVVNRASAFADGLLADLASTTIGKSLPNLIGAAVPGLLDKDGKFQLNTFLDPYLTAGRKIYVTLPEETAQSLVFPAIPSADDVEQLDFDQAVQFLVTYQPVLGYKFKTYDNGAFGLQLDVTKASLKTTIEAFAQMEEADKAEFEKQYEKMVQKVEFTLSVYFNEQALLEKVGMKFSAEVKDIELPLGEMGTGTMSVKASGETSVQFAFDNNLVQLPSDLASYEEIQLPQGQGGEVEPEPELGE